jgi:hypothetical protein
MVLGELDSPFANFLRKEFGAYRHALRSLDGLIHDAYSPDNEWDVWLSVRNKVTTVPAIHPLRDPTIQHVIQNANQYVKDICMAIRNVDGVLDHQKSRDIPLVTDDNKFDNEYVYSTARHIMIELIRRCVIGFCERNRHDDARLGDMRLNCLDRLHAVIKTLSVTKAACRDILMEDSRVAMLVNAPITIGNIKLIQKKTNESKKATSEKNKAAAAQLSALKTTGINPVHITANAQAPSTAGLPSQGVATSFMTPPLMQNTALAAQVTPEKSPAAGRPGQKFPSPRSAAGIGSSWASNLASEAVETQQHHKRKRDGDEDDTQVAPPHLKMAKLGGTSLPPVPGVSQPLAPTISGELAARRRTLVGFETVAAPVLQPATDPFATLTQSMEGATIQNPVGGNVGIFSGLSSREQQEVPGLSSADCDSILDRQVGLRDTAAQESGEAGFPNEDDDLFGSFP